MHRLWRFGEGVAVFLPRPLFLLFLSTELGLLLICLRIPNTPLLILKIPFNPSLCSCWHMNNLGVFIMATFLLPPAPEPPWFFLLENSHFWLVVISHNRVCASLSCQVQLSRGFFYPTFPQSTENPLWWFHIQNDGGGHHLHTFSMLLQAFRAPFFNLTRSTMSIPHSPCILDGTLVATRQKLGFSSHHGDIAYTWASFLNISGLALPHQDFWNWETTPKACNNPPSLKGPQHLPHF